MLSQLLSLRIVVDVKMLGLQDAPVEVLVLYFVAAVVVELRKSVSGGQRRYRQRDHEKEPKVPSHRVWDRGE